jgi:hypothetical protein
MSGWSRERSKGNMEVESARLPARPVSRVRVESGCEQPQQEASYSITSSAMASRDGGKVRLSAFRVLEHDDELTFGHLLDARTAGAFGGVRSTPLARLRTTRPHLSLIGHS